MDFQQAGTLEERLKLLDNLSERFRSRAGDIDEAGTFPYVNFAELKQSGYTALTVPRKFGGEEISLYEMVRLQEKLAEGDGSTALSIGWHLGITKNLAEKNIWEEDIFRSVCEEIKKGALLNGAATEPQTGSPTRGGRPQTSAVQAGGQWVVNGRKTFTTLSPILDFFIVSATIEDTEEVGNFLIPRSAAGVEIEETWDSIAMRGTGSHDLILKDVKVPKKYFVEKFKPGKKQASGWLLHIPACYLGIAQAAKSFALSFAMEYSPNTMEGTIIDFPTVRQKVGEMEYELMKARYFLYSVARQWDDGSDQERLLMNPELGAAKMACTNAAISVIDLAMRIVGARSLSVKNPLQRYYRDVRAGLHNPPMDDMTIELLAKTSIFNQR